MSGSIRTEEYKFLDEALSSPSSSLTLPVPNKNDNSDRLVVDVVTGLAGEV